MSDQNLRLTVWKLADRRDSLGSGIQYAHSVVLKTSRSVSNTLREMA